MVKTEEYNDYGAPSGSKNMLVPYVPRAKPLGANSSSGPLVAKEEGVSSSSTNNLRSHFIGMGFSPAIVEKVLLENGEDDANVILQNLLNYSDLEEPGTESSISLGGDFSFDSGEEVEAPSGPITSDGYSNPKPSIVNTENRSYLLSMDFLEQEVDSALHKLGKDASIEQLIDHIFTAEASGRQFVEGNQTNPSVCTNFSSNEESHAKEMYGVVEKTQCLLQMGFTKSEVNSAIQNLGLEASMGVLADWIIASRTVGGTSGMHGDANSKKHIFTSRSNAKMGTGFSTTKGKRSYTPSTSGASFNYESKKNEGKTRTKPVNHFDPPYFIYGSVVEISKDVWQLYSQFLFGIKPEFVNSQFFSALKRKEGYLHNLPAERRRHVQPRNSHGVLSPEDQNFILHECKQLNLIWVGKNKLAPPEPNQLERVLGYPLDHTQLDDLDPSQRLKTMKHCFQTDTIGYILSPMKDLYPDGLRVLSLYSGIGGAEVALNRLGLHLKCLVSVDASEVNRKILRRWWEISKQSGELRQLGGISKLTVQQLEEFVREFGGFDLVVGAHFLETCRGGVYDASVTIGTDSNLFFEFFRVVTQLNNIMRRIC